MVEILSRSRSYERRPSGLDPMGAFGTIGGGSARINACSSAVYIRGSVSKHSLSWANKYLLQGGFPFDDTPVVYQGGDWESATIERQCADGEDDYKYILDVNGVGKGDITARYHMTSGGGPGGSSDCCPSTSGGVVLEYTNPYEITDPLTGWVMHRVQSNMAGLDCVPGPAALCVTPTPTGVECAHCPDVQIPRLVSIEIGGLQGDLDPINRTYQILIIPGAGGDCFYAYDYSQYDADQLGDSQTVNSWAYTPLGSTISRSGEDVERVSLQLSIQPNGSRVIYGLDIWLTPDPPTGAHAIISYTSDIIDCATDDPITVTLAGSTDETNWPSSEWPSTLTIAPQPGGIA